MHADKVLKKWDLIPPTENNSYCLFAQNLEENPLILFHITPKRHFEAIAISGFRSSAELGLGGLNSVSYAKQSSCCLAHIGNEVREDYVVFAVEFDTLQQQGIADNFSDIHVHKPDIQPDVLGYCEIPKGLRIL